MKGFVQNLQAVLPVTFEIGQGQMLQIDCVVDTGFTGALTLPAEAVTRLQLPFVALVQASLADHSEISLPVHLANIHWNGKAREVFVLAIGRRPLVGTSLLSQCRFGAEFWEGGAVIIVPKGSA